jgi:hypothetical protein
MTCAKRTLIGTLAAEPMGYQTLFKPFDDSLYGAGTFTRG